MQIDSVVLRIADPVEYKFSRKIFFLYTCCLVYLKCNDFTCEQIKRLGRGVKRAENALNYSFTSLDLLTMRMHMCKLT